MLSTVCPWEDFIRSSVLDASLGTSKSEKENATLETLIELYRNAHTWSFQRQILCKIVKVEDFQEVKNVRNNSHENYIFKCFNLALFLKFFVVDIQMILDKKNLRSFEKDSLKKGWNRSKLKCSILKESGQFKLGYSWNALTSKLFKIVEKNFEMYFKPGITSDHTFWISFFYTRMELLFQYLSLRRSFQPWTIWPTHWQESILP